VSVLRGIRGWAWAKWLTYDFPTPESPIRTIFEDWPVSFFPPAVLCVPGDTYLEQKIEGVVEVTHGAEEEGRCADAALSLSFADPIVCACFIRSLLRAPPSRLPWSASLSFAATTADASAVRWALSVCCLSVSSKPNNPVYLYRSSVGAYMHRHGPWPLVPLSGRTKVVSA